MIGSSQDTRLEIKLFITSSASAWVSLAGATIATPLAFTAQTWVQPKMRASWVANSSSQQTFSITQRADGLVFTVGLIKSGSVLETIANIPAKMQMRYRHKFATTGAGGLAMIEFQSQTHHESSWYAGSPWVVAAYGSWLSFDSLKWFPDGLAG